MKRITLQAFDPRRAEWQTRSRLDSINSTLHSNALSLEICKSWAEVVLARWAAVEPHTDFRVTVEDR